MSKTGPARLDRSRSFGEVYGAGDCRYEQDHKEFDGQGREILKPGAKPAPAAEKPAPVTDTQPPLDDGAAAEPEVVDDLSSMTMSQLRAAYIEVTGGKKAKVGLNKAKIADMIREARSDEMPE